MLLLVQDDVITVLVTVLARPTLWPRGLGLMCVDLWASSADRTVPPECVEEEECGVIDEEERLPLGAHYFLFSMRTRRFPLSTGETFSRASSD